MRCSSKYIDWLSSHPHLSPLVEKLEALLRLADEAYESGRKDHGSVDYGAFEELSAACSDVECSVHQVVLSGLPSQKPVLC